METIRYTVQKGDTLFQIAKRFDTTVNMIARYNGIVDPDRIQEGQLLRIPVSEIPEMCRKKEVPTVDHLVKKGDTLASIALMHGVGVERIAAFNGLEDPDRIQEGQVLQIPVLPETERVKERVVRKGETLGEIAKQTMTTPEQLAELNGIADPDRIAAGQGLRLPETDVRENEVVVQQGDTLWKIAHSNGVSVADLINLNRLRCPDRLKAGQVLIIRKK